MPPLSDVDAMVSAARSRNIRLSFIIQNFSQLNDVYGKEKAETIRGNCGNTIYLLSTELAALEEISKMCGEVKSKKDDKTDSRPLVTVTDLQNFKEEDALILRSRMRPFKSKLKFEHKIEWGMSKEEATYPVREKGEVKIFDLKKYVEEQREKKINDMLNGNSSGPMMPPMGMPGMGGGFDPSSIFGKRESKPADGLNMDDLVKRIDAKIAELEEEEKREKEEAAKRQAKTKLSDTELEESNEVVEQEIIDEPKSDNSIVEDKDTKLLNDETVESESLEDNTEENNEESEVTEEFVDNQDEVATDVEDDYEDDYEEITDDQFFDDFFADD